MFGWKLIRRRDLDGLLREEFAAGQRVEKAQAETLARFEKWNPNSLEAMVRKLIEKGGHFYYEHELGTYEVSVKKVKR